MTNLQGNISSDTGLSTYEYTFRENGTLEASCDDYGNISNPDLMVEPNLLCTPCTKLIIEMLAIKRPKKSRSWPIATEQWRQGVFRGVTCVLASSSLFFAIDFLRNRFF